MTRLRRVTRHLTVPVRPDMGGWFRANRRR
jgi:hypothetical protein